MNQDLRQRDLSGGNLDAPTPWSEEGCFRLLSDAALEAVAIDDRGVILDGNKAFAQMFGYDLADLIGKDVLDLVAPESRETVRKYALSDDSLPCEVTGLRRDGTTFVTELRGKLLSHNGREVRVTVISDISKRKRAEESLRKSEEKYRRLHETMMDAFVMVGMDGFIKESNRAYQVLTGYSEAELCRLKYADLTPVKWHAFESGIVRDYIIPRGYSDVYEKEYRKKDGSVFPIELRTFLIRDDTGQPTGMWAVIRDITERNTITGALIASNRDLQDALKQTDDLQRQVIGQERLRALGQMASGIAHDFNNALVPILGYIDLLITTPDILDDRAQTLQYLESVRGGSLRAASSIARLRDFYRPANTSLHRPVDLFNLVNATVLMTQPKWKEEMSAKGVTIEIQTEITPLAPVNGDESELRTLITNLVFNAVEALPNGGKIVIRLYPHASEPHGVIEVQDNGIGMSEETNRRCFEPFFTTKNGQGAGLGLSVAHGIVQRHNGAINIQSDINRGAKVVVTLPLMDQCAAPVERRGDEHSPIRRQKVSSLRVLFVDDEAAARLLMRCFLELDGHIVTLANDGLQGLDIFKGEYFDLVILDRSMPGMNGDMLAAAIKSFSPGTPVIMLTGFGDIMKDQGEQPAAVDRVISKPLTRQSLRRTMAELLDSRETQPFAPVPTN